jgi:type IV pilus assembly protein PilW
MTLTGVARDARGFTLAELLIGAAMMAVILGAAVVSVQVGTQSSTVATGRAEAQGNARYALDRIVREVRAAGYDPSNAGFAAITTQSPTSITLQSDLNGNGVIDAPAGVCDANALTERIRYRRIGDTIARSANPADAACEATIVGGVQALTFTYLHANGTATATSADIRTIRVSLTVVPESATVSQRGVMAATMTDQARLRNR